MNKQQTLIQFEEERKSTNTVPPEGSNSYYSVGNGEICLHSIRDNKDDYRFDLLINKGEISTGNGNFIISGDISDISNPYNEMIIKSNTKLSVNQILTISKGKLIVHGELELNKASQLFIRDGAEVILYADSVFTIKDYSKILVENGATLTIYGRIDIHLSSVYNILNSQNVIIDTAAVMNVDGMDSLGVRPYSLTDYYTELSERVINIHTQGEKNFVDGRIGYLWTSGNPLNGSQTIEMRLLWGESILGDFKLSALGLPENEIPNLSLVSDIKVYKDTILYISNYYKDSRYMYPELYLGIIIGNSKRPANCNIDGTLIVDGKESILTIDRGATVHINEGGLLYMKDWSIMRSTYNEGKEILFIDGTLMIEDISQINTLNRENIVFGDNGKVIINNPDTGEKRLLWTTPNGIEDTDLYRLFKDNIDHMEYHISNNTGIGIDQYYEFYSRDMVSWFGGRRIEQAIYDGILVWHDGGFIELYHDIIPWIDTDSTLLQASRIFKTFGSYDNDKLQDAVNRLKYAGCGNILFRFINGDNVGEINMIIEGIKMKNIINYPMTDKYILDSDGDGELFLRNKVGRVTEEKIINEKSKCVDIVNNKAEFILK